MARKSLNLLDFIALIALMLVAGMAADFVGELTKSTILRIVAFIAAPVLVTWLFFELMDKINNKK